MSEHEKQTLQLFDRKRLLLGGVSGVSGFESDYVRLATTHGDLLITGSELKISSLALERGEAEVSGRIDSLSFSESGSMQKGTKKALKRLLK